ncbi:laminin subunit beta-1 [Asbolus verrucosus]|uniref:Laminin subunit beta-1 n=1 Tax=Asbolus verrucosus TaxID=1661398 RepID=A0A482V9B7_ASBVE|nr:laminin subunit beta-1 [Asbolus verrucosus]
MYPGTRQKSWWQSENGKENVYIQLDLEAEFHFTHLIITFKTFRPAAMLIERSYDFKQTWQVYRYFAYNCAESFPGIREGYPENLTDVVCESRYSALDPSTDGEIIYRVLPPTLHIDNPYSEQVQNLLKMTNLRINFTKLHTLGDDLLDKREDIQEKYYYAITDMVSAIAIIMQPVAISMLLFMKQPVELVGVFAMAANIIPWVPTVNNANLFTTETLLEISKIQKSADLATVTLMEKQDGCQPCDCDPGGSYDKNCDVISGQCQCREHMVGRTCSTPKQQHYTASLDFLLYEAESARSSANCQVVIREPYRDGSEITWTGIGFVKAFERSFIEFNIDDIRTAMDYEIAIRYEPTLPSNWEDVEVTIERPGPVDPNGPCHDARDEVRRVALPANSRSITVYPPVCLEPGRSYKVKLTFRRSNFERDTPSASVLIDSVVLIPRIEKIPWFYGSIPAEARRQEFERNHCASYPAYSVQTGQIPEVCKKYYSSIGAYIFNGAFSCQCDPTGSVSKLCDEYGGHCMCKINVVGRRCDRCSPGTYGFGPEGCRACDCNSIGALDNFCNATTGQCKCRANTYGRECDQCRTGFWNFPNCQRCDCNGHADICDSRTGACINCRDNTQGHNCDQCVEGFYGDPRLNVDIPCRPCPCPGIPGSNHSYAERCSLDMYTKDVVCECQEGYSGSRCDVCSDNYFGNPEEPGGSCQACDCNEKIDLLKPGNCDPHTGQCKQCLYETTGDHCEICRSGFFRYAEDRMCEECVCHILGTNSSAGPCDPTSGQCVCLPNVTGLNCDQCIPNHWKIASGEGCEPCNCDPQGSLRQQCNEVNFKNE